MKSTKRIIWGIALISVGVVMALVALGVITLPFSLSPGGVILGALALLVLIEGLSRLEFTQAFVMLGVEIMIFEKELGLLFGKTEEDWISNWTVLLISILVGIGFNMIFRSLRMSLRCKRRGKHCFVNVSGFGDHVKYIDASRMREEYIRNNFGDFEIHFENADGYKGDATLTVDNAFGDMVIYVPSSWEVSVDVSSSFGDVEVSPELCVAYGDDSGKKLKIKGSNRFGDMSIKSK